MPNLHDVTSANDCEIQATPGSDWFWSELDLLRARWDVRRHPFYVRWARGRLDGADMAHYAEEHDLLLCALATRARQAALRTSGSRADELANQADAEERDISLWREFARCTGWRDELAWCYAADPLPETIVCAQAWAGAPEQSVAEDLIALYSIKGAQASIAATKLDGLLEHYGFDHGPAIQYHWIHVRTDEIHARLARATFDELPAPPDPLGLLSQAEAIHRAYWWMLDALEHPRPA